MTPSFNETACLVLEEYAFGRRTAIRIADSATVYVMAAHGPGRVRSERARAAILGATRDLISEVGYERVTMEGIASRAGVGKQTVYRWWSSKSAILTECVVEGLVLPERAPPADSGDIRADLTAWFALIVDEAGNDANAALLRGLAMASAEDPSLATILYEQLTGPYESSIASRIERARVAGELREDLGASDVIEMLFGTLVYRLLSRLEVNAGFAKSAVDIVFVGIRPN